MKRILGELARALAATVLLALLLCGAYPGAIWAVAQSAFPNGANGTLVECQGEIRGSLLIAQRFEGPGYFRARPSAAGDGYDGAASGGSNLGPISKQWLDTVAERAEAYRRENGLRAEAQVPADAVCASASGLDPHITPRNAELQAGRVARARGVALETVRAAIRQHTEGRSLFLFGEPRVNVLALNLALDGGK